MDNSSRNKIKITHKIIIYYIYNVPLIIQFHEKFSSLESMKSLKKIGILHFPVYTFQNYDHRKS